jgi:hypothetical protein
MYLAELHGKFSPREERMEDILTSNVFSFFKYSSRDIFLKSYLDFLGIDVSPEEAQKAIFMFWPHYEDGTEPDLVFIVSKYYLLFEAKFYSGFGEKSETTEEQLIREIKSGRLEAKNFQKEFKLFAITADYYYKKEKFKSIPQKYRSYIKWTNWQLISFVLENILDTNTAIKLEEKNFASDLCRLLDKKCLRSYHEITYNGVLFENYNSIFFDAKTAKLRGDFIGFMESLSLIKRIKPKPQIVFFDSSKEIFESLSELKKMCKTKSTIFYKEGTKNE